MAESVAELKAQLAEYEEQLEQVTLLLREDPDNSEVKEMEEQLTELIALTKDMLRDALGGAQAQPELPVQPEAAAEFGELVRAHLQAAQTGASAEDGGEAAATGAAAEEVYVGVPAPQRVKAAAKTIEEHRALPKEPPKKLQILDTDDEATRAKKKKLLKQFKGRQRAAEKAEEASEMQNSWLSFKNGKGKKRKLGSMTNPKKDSIFKVPEGLGGRVGVVGSGKGMTDFAQPPQKFSRNDDPTE
mmetsp:Transcript_15346/g.50400  ORF Transcript_15346/g.50400 Transcript_15346/m.50400 type:complete len:244 (-) Transcript_15346:106-837(-)